MFAASFINGGVFLSIHPSERMAPVDLLLGASIPLLLPFGIALELLVLGLALVASWQLWSRRGQSMQRSGLRGLALIGALLIGAGACSAIGADWPARSMLWAISAVGYGLFAAFWILRCHDPLRRRAVLIGAALPVALWTVDALLQAVTGIGLGGRAEADRLSGIFGSNDLKLGPVLAMLAPFLLVPLLPRHAPHAEASAPSTAANPDLRTRRRRYGLLLAFLSLTLVVLLAGARAGWIGYAVGLVALVCFHYRQRPRMLLQLLSFAFLSAALLGATGYVLSERFAERVDRSLSALDGSRAGIDHALAGRVSIFETAATMASSNPINGVGIRNFRHAYPQYAAPGDPWVAADRSRGAAHPHYWPLEVLAEQGAIGALAWLAVLILLIVRWRRASTDHRSAALAPGLALLVLLFPLNTHPALYSSFWQALWWWALGLYLGSLSSRSAASRMT